MADDAAKVFWMACVLSNFFLAGYIVGKYVGEHKTYKDILRLIRSDRGHTETAAHPRLPPQSDSGVHRRQPPGTSGGQP